MRRALYLAALAALVTMTALACGDDDTIAAGAVDGGADEAASPDAAADTASPPPPPADGALPPVDATLVLRTRGELPEGIAYRGGETYLGFAATGRIVRVSATGTRSNYAQVPVSTTSASGNFLLGLAFDTQGNLYAGLSSANPPDPAAPAGIYKIAPSGADGGGGAAVLFASAANMQFPNGLAFDPAGRLFVADSGGRIFLVPAAGGLDSATVFLDDALLAGDNGACPLPAQPFPIGANGVVSDAAGSAMYVANTNKGSVVRVALPDAGAPVPTVLAQDCARLEGADGLAFDSRESSLLVTTAQNTVVRVTLAGGALSTVWDGLPLDFPASIVRIPATSSPEVYHLTNAAFLTSAMVDAGFHPQPGLVRLTVR